MLDDKDEFELDHYSQWMLYLCPSCGGFREEGCSVCAQYADIVDIHAETIRRMGEVAV